MEFSTGVACLFLLQGIFPTWDSNPGLPHGRQTLYPRGPGEALLRHWPLPITSFVPGGLSLQEKKREPTNS